MLIYERVETAWVTTAVLGALSLFVAIAALGTHQPALLLVMLFSLSGTLAFALFRVRVTDRKVSGSFTFGIPGVGVSLDDIERAEQVPIAWWWGIGIHYTPAGWLWNAAYGEAVRVARRSGGAVLLGTSDPQALLAAIEQARSGHV